MTVHKVKIVLDDKVQYAWSMDRDDTAVDLVTALQKTGENFFNPLDSKENRLASPRRDSLFFLTKESEMKGYRTE